MQTQDDEYRTVQVFQDSPAWDEHSRWFMLPSKLLQELFVAKYSVHEDWFDEGLAKIESEHPGCVYVY